MTPVLSVKSNSSISNSRMRARDRRMRSASRTITPARRGPTRRHFPQFDLLPFPVGWRPPRLRTADMAAGAAHFQQRVTGDAERQPDQALDRRRNVDFVPGRISLRRRIRRQRCRTSGAHLGAVLAPGGDRPLLTTAMACAPRLLAGPLPRPLPGRWPLAINRWNLFRLFRRASRRRLRCGAGSAALVHRVRRFLRIACLRPRRLAGRRTRAVVRVPIQPILQLLHVVQQALRHFQQELRRQLLQPLVVHLEKVMSAQVHRPASLRSSESAATIPYKSSRWKVLLRGCERLRMMNRRKGNGQTSMIGAWKNHDR
jgi:hypothetical protein